MGDPKGFLKTPRSKEKERPVAERIQHYREFSLPLAPEELRDQAARCMDCGIPFCHSGCPLGNTIPEWNDLVYKDRWEEALRSLHATNNFPEITGRVCPAPCEASCVLNLENTPVSIKAVEKAIAEFATTSGGLSPVLAPERRGRRVAVVGSGPAGLACAQQLARWGYDVTVFERDAWPGGLLRYGIPDFKLEKEVVARRVAQMEAEGVVFRTGVAVGVDVPMAELRKDHDAVVLAMGARAPRDLPIPGRTLHGVHFAMDFLTQQNKRVGGENVEKAGEILATGRRVVVIGGGDTGSDCVGTSLRQGAKSVHQWEIMPKPPLTRGASNPWPEWPMVLRTSSSQEEGCERDWAIMTKAFEGDTEGRLTGIVAVRVERHDGHFRPLPGSEFTIPCSLALLAMGFVGPEPAPWMEEMNLRLDARGNVWTEASGATSVPGLFAAGDVSRGQSLVVWAIADGRRVAAGVHHWLASGGQARVHAA